MQFVSMVWRNFMLKEFIMTYWKFYLMQIFLCPNCIAIYIHVSLTIGYKTNKSGQY